MNCNCGGQTAEHKVVRDKEVVGVYDRCTACGRMEWFKKPPDEILRELQDVTELTS